MIAIINCGGEDKDPEGWRTYQIRINGETIASFRHRRADGLGICLEKASRAVVVEMGRELIMELEEEAKCNQQKPTTPVSKSDSGAGS